MTTVESNQTMETEPQGNPDTSVSGDEGDTGAWVARIRARFAALGGVDLPILPREPVRDPPDFSGPEFDLDFDATVEPRSILSRLRS